MSNLSRRSRSWATSGDIDATVAQQGQKWTVTVNRPDGKTPIALVATMPGYNVVRRELRPSCGEVETLPPMRLKVLPAVFSVAIEPAETVLQATGDKSLASPAPRIEMDRDGQRPGDEGRGHHLEGQHAGLPCD